MRSGEVRELQEAKEDFILKRSALTRIFLWSHSDWSSAARGCNLDFITAQRGHRKC